MATIRTKDDIYLDIPDGMAPDAPEVREAVAAERSGRLKRRMASPEFQAKVAEQRAKDRETYDPTKDMSALDKIRANYGAGTDAVIQGAKQLVGLGASDEDIREKRARDELLAKKTDLGIGPDWAPTAGSALQFAGEAAPSFAIPMGAAEGVLAKVAPRILTKALAKPVASGAIGGAVSGALQPTTSDESRMLNTALGTIGGGALPLAVKAGRYLYRAGAPYVSGRAAQAEGTRRAGEVLSHAFPGQEASDLESTYAARQQSRLGRSVESQAIPESLSESTQSVPAAVLEARVAREPQNVGDWAAHERAQNTARWDAIQSATQEAPLSDARESIRKVLTEPIRAQALGEAGKDLWFHEPVVKRMAELEASDIYKGNPAVRKLVSIVNDSLDRGPTPGSLHELRKTLVSKLEGPAVIGDETSAAVKGAQRETVQVIKAIDEALETPAGNWGRFRNAYGAMSRDVEASEAAQLARDSLNKQGVSRVGDVARVTPTRLGTAMNESAGGGGRSFPLAMSQRGRQGLDDVMEQMLYSDEPQAVRKLAGTSGGGSHTETAIADALAQHALPPLGGITARVGRVFQHALGGRAEAESKRQLSQMLLDPPRAFAAIRAARAAGQELTPAQRAFYTLATRTAGAGAPYEMQTEVR